MTLIISFYYPKYSRAVESIATPTPSVSEETTLDLETTEISEEDRDEVLGLREEIKKKVEEKLKNIVSQANEKRGWVGIIEEIAETGLKISLAEKTREITTTEETVIVNDKRKEIDFKDLAVGNKVIILGYLQNGDKLEAKRIVLVPKGILRKTITIFGIITDKSKEGQILSVTPRGNEEKEYEVIVDDKSKIYKIVAGKIKAAKYEDIKVDQKAVFVLVPAKSNGSTYNPRKILILPGETSIPSPTLTKGE